MSYLLQVRDGSRSRHCNAGLLWSVMDDTVKKCVDSLAADLTQWIEKCFADGGEKHNYPLDVIIEVQRVDQQRRSETGPGKGNRSSER